MTRSSPVADAVSHGRTGGLIVMLLLLIGLTAASVAISFQRAQTRRCLALYGPEAAAEIARAPHVELWRLENVNGRLVAGERLEISQARGLVHLRRGLVEDANFDWSEDVGPGLGLPADAKLWGWAIVFSASADTAVDGPATRLVVDLGGSGRPGLLAVVGQPGRVRLGRIAAGLGDWIAATWGEPI
jgi:hypothetical protein